MRCNAHAVTRAASRPTPSIPQLQHSIEQASHRLLQFVSRRHGSNVPGPLECRRRQAKRRMVGLAQHTPSGMPDFGSLFGAAPLDVTGTWKWQAPLLDMSMAPSAAPLPIPLFSQTLALPLNPPTTYSSPPVLSSHTPTSLQARPVVSGRTYKEYLALLRGCKDIQAIVHVHASLHPDGTLSADFARAAFRTLLKAIDAQLSTHKLSSARLLAVPMAFLQHELNHEDAHSTHAYLVWLAWKNVTSSVLQNYLALLHDKVELRTLDIKELCSILDTLTQLLSASSSHAFEVETISPSLQAITDTLLRQDYYHVGPLQQSLLGVLFAYKPDNTCLALIARVLERMPAADKASAIPLFTKALSTMIIEMNQASARDSRHKAVVDITVIELVNMLPSPSGRVSKTGKILRRTLGYVTSTIAISAVDLTTRTTMINSWLDCLRQCNHLRGQPSDYPIWDDIYSTLAQSFTPLDLAAHFATLDAATTARVILSHWMLPGAKAVQLPRLGSPHKSSTSDSNLDGKSVSYVLSRVEQTPAAGLISEVVTGNVRSAFEARLAASSKDKLNTESDSAMVIAPYSHLVAVLLEHRVDHGPCLDQTIQLLMHSESPRTVYNFFMRLVRNESVHVPSKSCVSLIHYFINNGNAGYALRVFELSPDARLTHCPSLLLTLIESGPISDHTVRMLLNHPEHGNSLHMQLRSSNTNSLSEERVNLIHLAAYSMAQSSHMTPRQAFRKVCDLLRYLHDRRAPLFPLMSRALVVAGVTRPLQDGDWLGTAKFSWILNHVRALEGDDVADSVDKAAFKWRSQNSGNGHSDSGLKTSFQNELEGITNANSTRIKLREQIKRWAQKPTGRTPWA